jgi:hypothetical protein
MILICECGTELEVQISEGNNPGCAEREDVNCPNCNRLLHSMVYNDARVSIRVIKEPHTQSDTKK